MRDHGDAQRHLHPAPLRRERVAGLAPLQLHEPAGADAHERLGENPNTVRSRLARLRTVLSKLLSVDDGEILGEAA